MTAPASPGWQVARLHTTPRVASTGARPLVGVWDQWCVGSSVPYVKIIATDEGDERQVSHLSEAHCRQIVRNFGASKDDLPCTLGHHQDTVEKARYKVASYSAMACWWGGQVVEFATHNPAVLPPTAQDLPWADTGEPPEDGIYVYRARVTPLGASCIETVAVTKTSPEFVMSGRNQQAQDIGAQALGMAWTDDPFLNGCEINLERLAGSAPPRQYVCMVPPPEMAARLALAGGTPAAEMHCTLAVLERPNPAAARVLAQFAASCPPIEGTIGGPARFPGDGQDHVVALVDCPGLGALRQQLVDALEAAGCRVLGDHDFCPHITLAIIASTEPMPARIAPGPVRFTELVDQLGTQRQRHPLQEERAMAKKKFESDAGIDEKDDDKTKMEKVKAHYGRKSVMEAGVADADSPASAYQKYSAHMAKMEGGDATATSSQQHAEPDKDNMGLPRHVVDKMDAEIRQEMRKRYAAGELHDPKECLAEYRRAHYGRHGKQFEYEDPIVEPGAPTRIDEPPRDDTYVGAHNMERDRLKQDLVKDLSDQVKKQNERIRQFEATEQQRTKREQLAEAQTAVSEAWRSGRIVLRTSETPADAKARMLRVYDRLGKDGFEDALAPEGTQATQEQTEGRMTLGGLPAQLNFERAGNGQSADRPDEEIIRLAEQQLTKDPLYGKDPARKALDAQKRTEAVRVILMERRDLDRAWANQSRLALTMG